MGREFEVAYDGELLMYPLADRSAVWRFTPDGTDRWRCYTGMNDGEILAVHRNGSGEVVALDVATFMFERSP
jgi:outer membrane protein assembly factor BamB